MNNEEKIQTHYVKKTTTLWIAFLCLVVGFLLGTFYHTLFNRGDNVRKITVNQPVSPPPSGNTASAKPQSPQPSPLILKLEQQVAAEPQNAEAWARLGHAYFDIDDYTNAIRTYKKHLELEPDNADVWTDLGIMYRRIGNPTEAIRCFDKAIAADPRHQPSRYNKGVVLMHDLQDAEAAVKAWEELVAINPEAKTQDGRPIKAMIQSFRAPSPHQK
jgi:cytochrome c-type biogenesis protein CcmH/NrfG